jgi:hypothetical protein
LPYEFSLERTLVGLRHGFRLRRGEHRGNAIRRGSVTRVIRCKYAKRGPEQLTGS